MANILRRPMFRLGGQSSDGVGITSGLNRRNYANGPTTDELFGETYKMFQKSNKALEDYGKVGTPELMLTLSDVIRQGGSISDMIGNATSAVMPMAARYSKAQSEIGPAKFKNLAAMTDLGIKRDTANRQLDKQYAMELNRKAEAFLRTAMSDAKQLGKELDSVTIAEYEAMKIIALGKSFLSLDEARLQATKLLQKDDELAVVDQDEVDRIVGILTGDRYQMAKGGRVGLQNSFPGTVEEASMAEQIQTPGGVEDITENEEVIAEGQEMGGPKQDPFVILRARLPQEITDDVVKLIAYNPDAFKDFAAIETQQDVINFNETYGVELVLPTEQV